MTATAEPVRSPKIAVNPKPRAPGKTVDRPVRTVSAAPEPGAGEVGFLLQATTPEGDKAISLLAWPLVSQTWSSLSLHWQALRVEREFSVAATSIDGWIPPLAPNLCAPFRDANAAESTIGAAIGRLPVGLAIGIGDTAADAMLACLDDYATLAAVEARTPLRLIITDNTIGQTHWQEAIARSWRVDVLRGWHHKVDVKVWRDPVAPLPLELCRLITQAVARKLADPARWNPVYDMAEARIRVLPPALKSFQRRGKKG